MSLAAGDNVVWGLALVLLLGSCASASTVATPTNSPRPAFASATPTVTPVSTASPPVAASPGPTHTASQSPTLAASPTPTRSAAPSPAGSSSTPTAAVGYLGGHATIGPLSPVERADQPTPKPPPAVCVSRALEIDAADGSTEVATVSLDQNCDYLVPLPPGDYVVRLKQRERVGGSKDLPKTVRIESGRVTRLDISIDTGIR